MGRSPAPFRPSHQDSPVDRFVGSFGMSSARLFLLSLLVASAAPLALAPHAFAQTANDSLKPKTDKNAKMLVEANELVQNTDANTVSAVGNARIYYDGRTLEADKVVYNKTTKRLFAVGHAKLTEKDGTVLHGETFDLTDDFRDGFVDSLRVPTRRRRPISAHPAPSASPARRRSSDKGTYTACDACKNQSRQAAVVAGAREAHHPQERRADGLLRGRRSRIPRYPRGLHAIPFSSPDPTVTARNPGVSGTEDLLSSSRARLRRRPADLLQPRARTMT